MTSFDTIAMWAGYGLAGLAVAALTGFALLLVYAKLIYRRFYIIPFRRTQRVLSLSSWHHSRLVSKKDPQPGWSADDWPIGRRPFFLSYEIGQRRVFIMLGTMNRQPRHSAVKGEHPDMGAAA